MTRPILIVEDEKHLADGLRYNLNAEGFDVETVGTGEDAFSLLVERKQNFDVVVLDVMLPGIVQPDMKFFSASNLWRFSNVPIEATINRYWNSDTSAIKTRFEDGYPRLLLVSVDIQDATTVTFDSYRKEVDQGGNEVRKSLIPCLPAFFYSFYGIMIMNPT